MSKKWLSLILVIVILVSLLAACGNSSSPKKTTEKYFSAIKAGDLDKAISCLTSYEFVLWVDLDSDNYNDSTRIRFFVERPRRIEDLMVPHLVDKERPYRIVTSVQLTAIDYENFITDMLADRQFIEDYDRRCKKGEVWECLFVRSRGQADGVLIMPEQDCFVGWAAYCFK